MKRLTLSRRNKELKAIAALRDDQIDTSDIPELTDEQLQRSVRGLMYRPIKKPVTMRLDMDVIDWLKRQGPGYQTKANALLRQEMMRSYRKKKTAGSPRPSRAARAPRVARGG